MTVILTNATSATPSRPPRIPTTAVLAFTLIIGVWAIPDLATPLSTTATVLGGAATVYAAGRAKNGRDNSPRDVAGRRG